MPNKRTSLNLSLSAEDKVKFEEIAKGWGYSATDLARAIANRRITLAPANVQSTDQRIDGLTRRICVLEARMQGAVDNDSCSV